MKLLQSLFLLTPLPFQDLDHSLFLPLESNLHSSPHAKSAEICLGFSMLGKAGVDQAGQEHMIYS